MKDRLAEKPEHSIISSFSFDSRRRKLLSALLLVSAVKFQSWLRKFNYSLVRKHTPPRGSSRQPCALVSRHCCAGSADGIHKQTAVPVITKYNLASASPVRADATELLWRRDCACSSDARSCPVRGGRIWSADRISSQKANIRRQSFDLFQSRAAIFHCDST